jgi:hypothetical protein
VTVPSPRIDPEVQEINSATLPPTPSGAEGAQGATASEHESKDNRLEESELLLLSEEEEVAQPELGDGLPASKRVESPQLPIDPAVQQEPAVSSSISTTTVQVFT